MERNHQTSWTARWRQLPGRRAFRELLVMGHGGYHRGTPFHQHRYGHQTAGLQRNSISHRSMDSIMEVVKPWAHHGLIRWTEVMMSPKR